ncbi:Acetyl-coenzyme A carboxylase carboxyl transferase subunit [Coccomyxa sp. Obi]|nr:acetyl-CoA carboxylase-1 [Coccomyxa sp. Obi]BDA44272.1 Acetyl-coenzyme A carboxylase carboxyl transferase subunit [Coccomyxa sp. Obi]
MSQFSLPAHLAPQTALRQGSSLTANTQTVPPRHRCGPVLRRGDKCNVRAQAKSKKTNPDPPDTPKDDNRRGGREWLQQLLSKFGPITEKAMNTHVLDFEKPLVELDNRIKEVRKVAEENGVDVSEQVKELEERAKQLRKDTYTRLTPVQRLQVARHPNRPTFLDIALNISDKFVELHGDRAGLDDPAMVCGLASIDGVSFMFIGHQKGRNTKENIYRNFGMPQPNGYRKALRFMRHADHFGFPIVTFVDTPGAYAGKNAEELGQGEAIAVNLREMFGFSVPILSVVIGEGGSGGALAIGCANHNLIMEHSVYYVASPEACAAILWKSRDKAAAATEALRITSSELVTFGVMDTVIEEPLGGAHADPMGAFPAIKAAIMDVYKNKYAKLSPSEIRLDRYAKFRKLGMYEEFLVRGGQWREARAARAAAEGARTAMGTWAPTQEEAEVVEMIADKDEEWEERLKGKSAWINKPAQPPGLLRSGIMELSISMIEARRRQQAAAAAQSAVAQRRSAQADSTPSQLPSGNGSSYIPYSDSKERNGALVEAKADN